MEETALLLNCFDWGKKVLNKYLDEWTNDER